MKLFRAFAVASALLAFAIAVLGSWVRINNAGLTCPDWPLCHGQLVPPLAGGVVLEWSHRAVAFVETFVILGTIASGLRVRKSVAGVTPALLALAIIFALQVSLGGATVLLANSPLSVMLHWGMGMALLANLSILAVLAAVAPPRQHEPEAQGPLWKGPVAALAAAAALAFCTMCAGAYVSSSFAGLACASVPACDGTVFGNGTAQHVQMIHRLLAAAFALAALAALYATRRASGVVRTFAAAGCALVLLQVALGIANVVWQLPTALREAHAANAGATFLAFIIGAVLAAVEPHGARARRRPLEAAARPGARRVASSA